MVEILKLNDISLIIPISVWRTRCGCLENKLSKRFRFSNPKLLRTRVSPTPLPPPQRKPTTNFNANMTSQESPSVFCENRSLGQLFDTRKDSCFLEPFSLLCNVNVYFFLSGSEPSVYEIGVDMVTGSLLPSHSDVQLSCLTGERIKVMKKKSVHSLNFLVIFFSYIHVTTENRL